MTKKTQNQNAEFSLNTVQVFSILKAVPENTRCFQAHEESSYDGDYVGTVGHVLATLNQSRQTMVNLQWNLTDETVRLIDLAFTDASEFDSAASNGEYCVLMMYQQSKRNMGFPSLGTQQIPKPKLLRSINLSTKRL